MDPQQPTRREQIPQALPAGLSAAGLYTARLAGRSRRAVPPMPQGIVLRQVMSSSSHALGDLDDLALTLMASPMSARSGLPRRPKRRHEMRGRIVLRRYRELVVEITVDRRLAWDPSDASAVWDDGTECGAGIDATRSTRAGAVTAGTVIRLVLRLDDTAPPSAPA